MKNIICSIFCILIISIPLSVAADTIPGEILIDDPDYDFIVCYSDNDNSPIWWSELEPKQISTPVGLLGSRNFYAQIGFFAYNPLYENSHGDRLPNLPIDEPEITSSNFFVSLFSFLRISTVAFIDPESPFMPLFFGFFILGILCLIIYLFRGGNKK